MTISKFRSTDYPFRYEPFRVCTTPEEARAAALSSVSVTCLDCGTSFGGDHLPPNHECRDSKGRDNGPMKRARAEGARRELEALKRFPIPPCAMCGKEDMRPGEQHTCVLRQEPLPHELLAAEFQRKGSMAVLAAELQEIHGGPR